MDQQAFVEELKRDLELEYRSIVQYVQHIASVKGARYQQTLKELDSHVGQELSHAMKLAQQIDFLGAVPSTTVPEVAPQTDAVAALEDDLALETGQLERYRARVDQAQALGLPDVAEALTPLLQQTQDHVRELRQALGR
jgi:bacterioferritin